MAINNFLFWHLKTTDFYVLTSCNDQTNNGHPSPRDGANILQILSENQRAE